MTEKAPSEHESSPEESRRKAAGKIIQIATIGYSMSNGEYVGNNDQLIALTDDGQLFVRDLGTKGSQWETLEGPTPGVNIDGPAHADQQPMRFD